MYESFYGLHKKPFQMVPDPAFLYMGERYKNAITYLEYGLAERVGFILLTGDIGTGKTTLVKYLLSRLDQDISPAVVFNTNVDADELLRLIIMEFELNLSSSKAANVNILNDFLIAQYAAGKRPLLVIDEAQNLDWSALEEIRMLFNLQTENQLLLQIVLVGQTNLRQKLMAPDLEQIRQRIGVRFHLSPLSREETDEYIAVRLEKAGGKPDLFLPETIDLIFQESRGVPRTINIICDAALVYGVGDGLTRIPPQTIREVIDQTLGHGLCMQGIPSGAAQGFDADTGNDKKLFTDQTGFELFENRIEEIFLLLEEQNNKIADLENKLQPHDLKAVLQFLDALKEKTENLSNKNLELEAGYTAIKSLLKEKDKSVEQIFVNKQPIQVEQNQQSVLSEEKGESKRSARGEVPLLGEHTILHKQKTKNPQKQSEKNKLPHFNSVKNSKTASNGALLSWFNAKAML